MADCLPKYKYKPLSSEASEIRLLNLHPGDLSSGIKIALITASFDDDHSTYEALSYIWGDPTLVHTITIDGYTLDIADNLYHALCHLRYKDSSRLLWIDAICINQLDLEEKNYQVPQMTLIYRRARRVVCWLGEETGLVGNAFAKLEKLAIIEDHRYRAKPPEAQSHKRNVFELQYLELQRDSNAWDAISDLVSRHNWRRAWIVQEVLSAENIVLLCGENAIAWTVLIRAWFPIWYAFRVGLNRKLGDVTWLHSLLQWEPEQEKRSSMLDHLHEFREWQVTNPLDRIYAFIGLPCREDTTTFSVDYHYSEAQLYQKFAKWHLSETQTLDILSYVGLRRWYLKPGPFRMYPLESWVPVWTHTYKKTIGSYSKQSGNPVFHASSNTKIPRSLLEWSGNLDLEFLRCIGFEIDRIQKIGDELVHRTNHRKLEPSSGTLQQWEAMLSSLRCQPNPYSQQEGKVADGHGLGQTRESPGPQSKTLAEDNNLINNPGPNDLPLVEAFWRTLIADYWPWATNVKSEREGRANAEVWQHFLAWRFGLSPRDHGRGLFQSQVDAMSSHRRYMITERNYMGLVSSAAEVGDKICIFRGGQTPFVIRDELELQVNNTLEVERFYSCIGECYLHGMMDGEAMEGPHGEEREETLFYLI